MSIRTAPCHWPLVGDCPALDELDPEPDPEDPPPEPPESATPIRDAVVEAATSLLWNWTGRVFGLCEVEVRPCRQDCQGTTYGDPAGGAPFAPALVGGVWRNITCGACGNACSCSQMQAVRLPGPVDSIVSVTIGGEDVPPEAYRVDNRTLLVRDDGGAWPTCQDLSKPAGEPGTWSVVYQWGVPVPSGGQIAAGALACELAKAIAGDRSCELPRRVQTMTREGVTVGFMDTFEGLEDGKTGLWLVDSWVASMTKPPARSTVHLPGRPRPTVTTFRGEAAP